MQKTFIQDLNIKKNRFLLQKLRFPLIIIVITFSISILGLTLIPGLDANGNETHMSYFDAMYFILYTATTIGYGEGENPLTYTQKIWVSFSILFTVISWFYAVSNIIALIQDKDFMLFLKLSNKRSKIESLKSDFVIIAGYSYASKNLIKKILKNTNLKIVLLEDDSEKNKEITLEFLGNDSLIHLKLPPSLKDSLHFAGINKSNCVHVVAISDNHRENIKTAINSSFLNKDVKFISHNKELSEDREFKMIGQNKIINSYNLIGEELYFLFRKPELSSLVNWLHTGTLYDKLTRVNNNKLLVVGYGKLGKALEKKLSNIVKEITFVDNEIEDSVKDNLIFKNLDARYPEDINKHLNISEYDIIFLTTKDDYINYVIANTIKKIDKKSKVFVKLNFEINEQLFKQINNDIRMFNIDEIISAEAFYRINNKDFLKILKTFRGMDDKNIKEIYYHIQENYKNPMYKEIEINKLTAPAIYKKLSQITLPLETLLHSLSKNKMNDKIKILFLIRKKEVIFINEDNIEYYEIHNNDKVFFIYDDDKGIEDIEIMSNDISELNYVINKMGLLK